jgi:hypothetical protein
MAIQEPQTPIQMQQWLAETVRATIFPAPGATFNVATWWHQATGRDPESRTEKPATRERVEEGSFDGARLLLTVNPLGIIQWQLLPVVPTEPPSDILNVGPLIEVQPRFSEMLTRWFPSCPPANRIAFGAVVLLPVRGHREGYERLGSLLRRSVNVDPAGSSDFLYRINRQRPSAAVERDRLQINRLSTWTVLKMSTMVASAGAAGTSGRIIDERYACRVELDINTSPTYDGVFQPEATALVFEELEQMGLQILAEGDIP